MAYRLERNESVNDGLTRVIGEELKSARELLSSKAPAKRDEAIHEARKSVKKVRGALRLAGPAPGRKIALQNEYLRDAGRTLSLFRDATAIIEIFDDLRRTCAEQESEADKQAFDAVRAALTKRKTETESAGHVQEAMTGASRALAKIAASLKGWKLKGRDFGAIAPGLKHSYRLGRKALRDAIAHPEPERFHDLRKRVKDHWYHVRLLEGMWTTMMKPYEKSLKDLETWLGDDHNLSVLRQEIDKHAGKRVIAAIGEYQKKLRADSIALAERIYAEKPGAFTARMESLWTEWRVEKKPAAGTGSRTRNAVA